MSGDYILLLVVFLPIIGAIISYLIGRRNKNLRDYFAQIICIVEFFLFVYLLILFCKNQRSTEFIWSGFCGKGMYLALDGFRVIYGTIASFMWMMTMLFSKEYFKHYHNRNRYYLFTLLTLGATIGVFLSSDLFTTFIFFEVMSFTSYAWVAHDEKKESLKAAETYLAVAVIGGLVMLMGLFLLQNEIGTLRMSELLDACSLVEDKAMLYIAGTCILFGFGAKAGAFPLHIWLPKAHPVAPAPASALLSGVLTKSGIFGILVVSCNIFFHDAKWGFLILVLGLITMFTGALLALFSNNLKRTLACSSMSQIGFVLVGIGMVCFLGEENALAVRGSFLHMINHSLIKLVLFMAAGVVFMNIHKLDLNEIRGFGKKKPVLHFAFLMGALGIGGIPLWNGYISKTLIHESIIEYIELLKEGHMVASFMLSNILKWQLFFQITEWIFLISGGITVAYMLKLYICLFIEKNHDTNTQEKYENMRKTYLSKMSMFTLLASAIILPILGVVPNLFMDSLASMGQAFLNGTLPIHKVFYFAFTNLKGGFISIVFGIIIYFVIVRLLLMKKTEAGQRIYVNRWPNWLDLENLIYRPLLLYAFPFLLGVVCRALDSFVDGIVILLRKTIYKDRKIPQELIEGNALTHTLGVMLDTITQFKNKVFHIRSVNDVSYVHRIAVLRDELVENNTIIARSLSFGLFMFCFGLCLTLVYLLFV